MEKTKRIKRECTGKDMTFPNNLRLLRKNLGLTQKEVGIAMGAGQQSITQWETGRTEPNLFWLKALSSFYRISIDELLSHNFYRVSLEDLLSNKTKGR